MKSNQTTSFLELLVMAIVGTLISTSHVFGQSTYDEYVDYFKSYDFSRRVIPTIPEKGEKIKVIIDSDAKNEVDDQWALALALLSPERFDIKGIIGTTFAWGGSASVQKSVDEIDTILHLMELTDNIPVYAGSHPMRYKYEPAPSEGVDFIIREALKASPEDPLWVVGLGAATNIASAILQEPKIMDRVVVFWHLRTAWPEKCINFNVYGDPYAARLLFDAPIAFVLFDTGSYLYCPMDESEKK